MCQRMLAKQFYTYFRFKKPVVHQANQMDNCIIEISAIKLQPGMYIYTLAVDGQETEYKRMIITEE